MCPLIKIVSRLYRYLKLCYEKKTDPIGNGPVFVGLSLIFY